ncbi:peptidylprolyl isomerase [uncultured Polaribacter sp.]|uniref:peptidylprolyl isomerase n=1 Tax=uncultured Polaribacter sp. TaxID=174711 RepID=UPI00260C0F4F|nr:peptidylprolyl isomerase [uncultured Polaribacter sp.]
MSKIKSIFFLVALSVIVFISCDEENFGFINPFEDVDYEALAKSDNDSIVQFLSTHYYDANLDDIRLINAGQTALINDTENLKIKDVTQNDIDYKLYVYITEEGKPNSTKGNPTKVDSVFISRTEIPLINNSIAFDPTRRNNKIWWNLVRTFVPISPDERALVGAVNAFPFFRPGENITNNGPITYQNTGKGYVFMPSGLAYPSIDFVPGPRQNIDPLFDIIIVYKLELLDFVENTDHDNDGKATIEEDANGDGDPTNDFSDTSRPNLPDYLNPNIN